MKIQTSLIMSYFDGALTLAETVSSLSQLASVGEEGELEQQLASDGGRERWRALDNRGWSALHHAAGGGHQRCVELLGQAGERAMLDARCLLLTSAAIATTASSPATSAISATSAATPGRGRARPPSSWPVGPCPPPGPPSTPYSRWGLTLTW